MACPPKKILLCVQVSKSVEISGVKPNTRRVFPEMTQEAFMFSQIVYRRSTSISSAPCPLNQVMRRPVIAEKFQEPLDMRHRFTSVTQFWIFTWP